MQFHERELSALSITVIKTILTVINLENFVKDSLIFGKQDGHPGTLLCRSSWVQGLSKEPVKVKKQDTKSVT